MTTTVIGTGETYTTPASYISTLGTLSAPEILELKDETGETVPYHPGFTISGKVTTATNRITIRTASGASFNDSEITQLYYNTATDARIESTSGYAVIIDDDHVDLEDLKIRASGGHYRAVGIGEAANGNTDVNIRRCILNSGMGYGNSSVVQLQTKNIANSTASIEASLLIAGPMHANTMENILFINADSGDTITLNNVSLVAASGVTPTYGIRCDNTGTYNIDGVSAFGIGTFHNLTNSASPTYTDCFTDDVITVSGVTDSVTYADEYEDSTNDWRLVNTADQYEVMTSNLSVDIGNTSYPGSSGDNAGCWQHAAAGGGGRIMGGLAGSGGLAGNGGIAGAGGGLAG